MRAAHACYHHLVAPAYRHILFCSRFRTSSVKRQLLSSRAGASCSLPERDTVKCTSSQRWVADPYLSWPLVNNAPGHDGHVHTHASCELGLNHFMRASSHWLLTSGGTCSELNKHRWLFQPGLVVGVPVKTLQAGLGLMCVTQDGVVQGPSSGSSRANSGPNHGWN